MVLRLLPDKGLSVPLVLSSPALADVSLFIEHASKLHKEFKDKPMKKSVDRWDALRKAPATAANSTVGRSPALV
jgi:hypothetical protein